MPTIQKTKEYIPPKNLDISIVDLEDSFDRIDAEYYKPSFLLNENLIEKSNFDILKNISDVRGGKRIPLTEKFSKNGSVPYIRAEDIKDFVEYENSPKISLDLHNKLKNYQTKYNDVLISIVGTIGNIGIIRFNLNKCNLTENACKIINLKSILPGYLFIFLKSKFGKFQIKRETVGTNQPKLALVRIRNIKIPILPKSFQEEIAGMVQEAHKKREKSKKEYQEVENILLEELGLENWKPTEKNIAIHDLNDVKKYGRMDAEYFQPKYEDIIEEIKKYKGGFDTLENLIEISDKKIKLNKNKEYQYCELADIDSSLGIVSNYSNILGFELPSRAKMAIEKDLVVVSSVRGSSKKIALVENSDKNLVASTGFFILKEKYFLPEVNLLLMKSLIGQEFLKRSARGMILSATNKGDFSKFIIPKIDKKIQKQIAEKIQKSHKLRKESKGLLEGAKRKVEEEIEK